MAGKLTFAMLKPDAVAAGNAGAILAHVEKSGFAIKAMRMLRLTRVEAEAFYAVHKARPFFNDLVAFMVSGPVMIQVLEGGRDHPEALCRVEGEERGPRLGQRRERRP